MWSWLPPLQIRETSLPSDDARPKANLTRNASRLGTTGLDAGETTQQETSLCVPSLGMTGRRSLTQDSSLWLLLRMASRLSAFLGTQCPGKRTSGTAAGLISTLLLSKLSVSVLQSRSRQPGPGPRAKDFLQLSPLAAGVEFPCDHFFWDLPKLEQSQRLGIGRGQ